MERRAKERLIGASILVILIVLIAPELLSGPAKKAPPAAPTTLPKPAGGATAEPSRSVTVDLNTSRSTATEPDSAAGVEPAAAASTADSTPITEPTVSAPPTAVSPAATPSVPPSPTPRASVESAAPPPTSAGAWSVQIGSFANRGNVDKLVNQLKGQGYAAYVAPQGSGRSHRYRVRVGPVADRAAAERVLSRLKGQGHAGSIVSPGTK